MVIQHLNDENLELTIVVEGVHVPWSAICH